MLLVTCKFQLPIAKFHFQFQFPCKFYQFQNSLEFWSSSPSSSSIFKEAQWTVKIPPATKITKFTQNSHTLLPKHKGTPQHHNCKKCIFTAPATYTTSLSIWDPTCSSFDLITLGSEKRGRIQKKTARVYIVYRIA